MDRFTRNTMLDETMKSHLIDIETYGVMNDDYDTFFEKRIIAISDALKSKIILQDCELFHFQGENEKEHQPSALCMVTNGRWPMINRRWKISPLILSFLPVTTCRALVREMAAWLRMYDHVTA